ncbi:hypothetical protein AGOR_G00061260 [Albula goreensis]|uniref:Uncharacterized protein n=1 Tax=Albula goreensis TaxID=1534307 RepID=A0A8T3DXL0_9TELE|nr:hypothetical protein AGOR_G00061260 [Albula goreensis]
MDRQDSLEYRDLQVLKETEGYQESKAAKETLAVKEHVDFQDLLVQLVKRGTHDQKICVEAQDFRGYKGKRGSQELQLGQAGSLVAWGPWPSSAMLHGSANL